MKRIRWEAIVLAVLFVASAGLNIWQYTRLKGLGEESQAHKVELVTGYQRVLYESVDALNNMEVRFSKLMLTRSQPQIQGFLSDIASLAAIVEMQLAQLPVDVSEWGDTFKFIAQVEDYAKALIQQVASTMTIADAQYDELAVMMQVTRSVRGLVQGVLDKVLSGGEITTGEGGTFHIDFQTEDKSGAIDYPTLVYDGPFSDGENAQMKALGQNDVSKEEAIAKAKAFIGEGAGEAKVVGETTGDPVLPLWLVDVTVDGTTISLGVSQKGGEVIWMVNNSVPTPGSQQLSQEEAVEKATEYLYARGYSELYATYWQEFEDLAVINFAAVQDDVILYPDLVKVQISRSSGAIIAIEARTYWGNHQTRTFSTPILSQQVIHDKVDGRFEIITTRLCVIPKGNSEWYCYEVRGVFGGEDYLLYFDAVTGDEVNILKIVHTATGELTM